MPTAVKNCFGGRGGANNESGALYEPRVLTECEGRLHNFLSRRSKSRRLSKFKIESDIV